MPRRDLDEVTKNERIIVASTNRVATDDEPVLCWKQAHESAPEDRGREGAWVYAYLHCEEGDQENAAYWYARAGKPVCREPLDAEWISIANAAVVAIAKTA